MVRKPEARIPPASSVAVSHVMAANRGRDTSIELLLRASIRRLGMTGYRANYRISERRVDLAFPSKRVAIFVHGCFWHRCPTCNLALPKTHTRYWKEKFERNAERDVLVRGELEALGWQVAEIWEHEIREDSEGAALRVQGLLERNPSG